MENPNFYAIIPASVRYDSNLKPNAKLLYGEITALCNQEGYCWASNHYFSKLYNVSRETISRWISQLNKYNHINVIIENEDITNKKRRIYINQMSQMSNGIDEKVKGSCQKGQGGIDEKVKYNNTVNITNNIYKTIVDYLNSKTGKSYKHNTNKTKSCIDARLNEGFTVEDFKKVIDTKTKDWKGDNYWEKFLRPETLFGNKFEGYLNEYITPKNVKQVEMSIEEIEKLKRQV